MSRPDEFCNPYHFVPVEQPDFTHWKNKQDFLKPARKISHDRYHEDRLSGRIICTLTTETPIFIGAEREKGEKDKSPSNSKPFLLPDGQPAIPATSLRGLISSIAEGASNSALRVLEDKTLSFRKQMEESLSAIGMIEVREEDGNSAYYIKPLCMPTLFNQGRASRDEFSFDPRISEHEREAYTRMFPKPMFKVYLNGYGGNGLPERFLQGKHTFVPESPEFYYALMAQEHAYESDKGPVIHDSGNDSLHIKNGCLLAQKTKNGIAPKSEREWSIRNDKEKWTRGILRILGYKRERDLPNTKKHEVFIPYTEENLQTFPIIGEAIERFEQLADERSDATDDESSEHCYLPYHLKNVSRNSDPAKLGNKLRLKHGDLVYFRPTMKDGKPVVAEISFSSIWRGRVEDKDGNRAGVYSFFKQSFGSELLPFHKGREKLSPAELLFGFVQQDEEGKESKDEAQSLAFMGRVRFSLGCLSPEHQGKDIFGDEATLKTLGTPKLPAPAMYFKSRYDSYIPKNKLMPGEHVPQGRKMYLNSHKNNGSRYWETSKPNDRPHLKTRIKPIRKGTTFYFHVDFDNLNEWELGLLCYALSPSAEFQHKIGMGKPIGLGSARIAPVGLFLVERQKRYAEQDIFNSSRYTQSWVMKDWAKHLPIDRYADERKAEGQVGDMAEKLKELRQLFKDGMSQRKTCEVLEILGNPAKVPCKVQTPQCKGLDEETETFEWFVSNSHKDQQHPQCLIPIDKKIHPLKANMAVKHKDGG